MTTTTDPGPGWGRPGSSGSATAIAAPPPTGPPPMPTVAAPDPTRRGPWAPTAWLLALMAVVAVGVDLVLQARVDALAGTLVVVTVAFAVIASGRVRNPQAVVLAVAGVVVALYLSVRTSLWLVPLDAVLAAGLVGLAMSYARGGSLLDVTMPTLVARAGRLFLSAALAPAYLLGALGAALPTSSPARRARAAAIGRGLGLAVPALVVLGLLLASADAVFGSLFRFPFDAGTIARHLVLLAGGLLVGSFVLVEVSSAPVVDVVLAHRRLGSTEASVVLGGVVLLDAVFAGVQVLVASRGEDYVASTAGVTYAEHARQGFFQLLAVAALTLVLLASLRVVTARPSRGERIRFVVLSEAVVALTLVIVGVAVSRLGLYEQAFGLTMLRYACTWVAWGLGAVFVLVGVATTGLGAGRRWLLVASGAALLVGWLAFNAVNPEAVVAQRNLDHAAAGHRLDGAYLVELTDDAVPTVAAGLGALPLPARVEAIRFVCRPDRPAPGSGRSPAVEPEPEPDGLWFNASRRRADVARLEVCGR